MMVARNIFSWFPTGVVLPPNFCLSFLISSWSGPALLESSTVRDKQYHYKSKVSSSGRHTRKCLTKHTSIRCNIARILQEITTSPDSGEVNAHTHYYNVLLQCVPYRIFACPFSVHRIAFAKNTALGMRLVLTMLRHHSNRPRASKLHRSSDSLYNYYLEPFLA